MSGRCYLDHAASSPLRPAALAAMVPALNIDGNASSVHREGRHARQILEAARRDISAWLGIAAGRLVFTSGATEANAAVLAQARGEVLVSTIEHPSVLDNAAGGRIAVDGGGLIDLADLQSRLVKRRPKLVSVMAVNNEIGVIQPIAEIAGLVHAQGALLHVDAVQALGRSELNVDAADYVTLSAHKIGGPTGIGAIILPDGVPWRPLFAGGGQEQRRRSGTEAIAAAAGFAAALGAVETGEAARIGALRSRLDNAVGRDLRPVRTVAAQSGRAPHISALTLPGKLAETLVMQLDLMGIAVSAGSACSSGKVRRSHVLEAMGLPLEDCASTIRVSLGWSSQDADIERLLVALSDIVAQTSA